MDKNNVYNPDIAGLLMQSIDKLAESHNRTNEKVDKLTEAIGQYGVILERLASMDNRHADSMNRAHAKMDDISLKAKEDNNLLEKRIELLEVKCEVNTQDLIDKASTVSTVKDLQSKMRKLGIYLVLVDYPKIAFTILLFAISLLVKESRDLYLSLLGVL